jgi:hypothetical protein
MQFQTITNSPRENITDFRAVTTLLASALHPSFLVHDLALNNPIPDCLAHDIFCIFLRVKVELDTNIAERYARVRKGKTANSRFYHILAEADNERVGLVRLKLSGMFVKRGLKLGKRSGTDG